MERLVRIARNGIARAEIDPVVIFALSLVPLLSILDFYLTLVIISRGGIEANPLFAHILPTRPQLTYWVKFLLTTAGVSILAATSRYRASRAAAFALPLVYSAVIVYEIVLLTVIIP